MTGSVPRAGTSERPLRLALLGLNHETNTFSPLATGDAAFEEAGILLGDEIVAEHGSAHTAVAGLLLAADGTGVAVVPLIYTQVTPSGTIERATFERLLGQLVARLAEDGPWDGVLVALHGAAVAEGHPDADGDIAERIRDTVGPGRPVGVTIDMHANLSPRLAAAVDVLVGYRTNPHIDARERGAECAALVVAAARGAIDPVVAIEQVPAVIGIVRQATHEQPMRTIMTHAVSQLAAPGVLSVSVTEGYPYADVPQLGMTAVAVTDGDLTLARTVARSIAARIWDQRGAFDAPMPDVPDAIAVARSMARGPVVLLDVGDNVGGGGPGDSTVLLEAALAAGVHGIVTTLHDAPGAGECAAAGWGGDVDVMVGGRGGAGGPVRVRGTVTCLSDGRFEEPTATHGGIRFFDGGPTAVIATEHGDRIVLTSRRVLPTSLQQLRSVGVEPLDARIVIAKGVVSPQAAYGPIASHMILVDTPGVTTARLDRFTYRQRRRPLYPFEQDTHWPPAGAG